MKKTIVRYKNAIIALIMIILTGTGASASVPWTVNPGDYRYDMSLYLEVDFANVPMDYTLYDVGVFCGEECRGIGEELALGNGKSCLYVRVRSNVESGETMTFRYYDRETEEVAVIEDASFTFESNGRLGYPSDPYVVRIVEYYEVSVSAGAHGSVDNTGGRVEEGTELTITATPDEGYHFEKWSDGSTDNPRTIIVKEDMTLSAELEVNTYRLTLYLNGEEYSSEDVEFGSPLSIDDPVVPEGYKFDGWTTEIPLTMPASDLDIYGTYSVISSVAELAIDGEDNVTVCTLSGEFICKGEKWSIVKNQLTNGIYIINDQKMLIRR
jgi:hypothetical protein